MSSAAANPNYPVTRPIAEFKPSETEAQEEVAKELKKEVYREFVCVRHKALIEQLCLVDSIERLGVAYHFEKEIEDVMQRIHQMPNSTYSHHLFLTSLRFRLLRQHGFKISCDVFEGFKSLIMGSLNEVAVASSDDVGDILSLYEACHVRIHGEDMLDEAFRFTTSKLKLIQDQLSDPLIKERVSHSLHKALHRRLTLVEAMHHMKVYEQDPKHNKTLLQFAKVSFNLLQLSHKKELSDVRRWWRRIGLTAKLPIRNRHVECHFWALGVYFEPQYSMGRKITSISAQVITSLDDLYDAYGTLEELKIFTEAVQRWDKSYLDQLPEVYSWFYQTLLVDVLEEMERDLAPKGRSVYVDYAREEVKGVCEAYLLEASWRHRKYIPTFDEYMETFVGGTGFVVQTAFVFLGMDMATHEAFEWFRSIPKPFKAACLLSRTLNDIASPAEIDKTRGHACLMIESYMRQYEVSYEQATKDLLEKTHELWKEICEAMILPTEVPMPLLKCMLNYFRVTECLYDRSEDAFTSPTKAMIEDITGLYGDPIPV